MAALVLLLPCVAKGVAQTPVDLELSLVIDVSGSVDSSEYALQRDGYVNAFRSASLQTTLANGQFKQIAVNVVQFSSSATEVIPFTLISNPAQANAFADTMAAMVRAFSGGTSPDTGIDLATTTLNSNSFNGSRRVIDVSGDGTGSSSDDAASRDRALANGVTTINGVVIGDPTGTLQTYYQQFIIGGSNAFVESAADFTGFDTAVARKLLREIGGTAPIVIVGVTRGGFRIDPTITVTDFGAIFSANTSGLPVAMVQRDLSLLASRAGVRDLNARLFRLRSRMEENQIEATPPGKAPVGKAPVGKSSVSYGKQTVETPAMADPVDTFEIFASGDYSYLESDGQFSGLGFESDVMAGSLGLEYDFAPWLSGGLAATVLEMDTELAGNFGDVDLDGFLISPYVSFFRNNFYADVLYSYGTFDHGISRGTLLGNRVRGETDSSSHRVEFNTGYNFRFGGLVTGPTAGAEYLKGKVDAYRETGAPRAILDVDGQDYESLSARVGWQISAPMHTNLGKVTPQLRAGYVFEQLSADDETKVALLESPVTFLRGGKIIGNGGKYETSARPQERDLSYAVLGAGVRWEFRPNMSLFADYEAQLGDRLEAHYASLKISLSF